MIPLSFQCMAKKIVLTLVIYRQVIKEIVTAFASRG